MNEIYQRGYFHIKDKTRMKELTNMYYAFYQLIGELPSLDEDIVSKIKVRKLSKKKTVKTWLPVSLFIVSVLLLLIITDKYQWKSKIIEMKENIRDGGWKRCFKNLFNKKNDKMKLNGIIKEGSSYKAIINGEIVKAVLKIVNITNELIKISETYEKNDLLNKIQHVNGKLMKFIITNKSLYV